MLKYLYCKEVFSEVPGEISLGLSISGCQIHCYGCHSRELWEDVGTPLTTEELQLLISKHKGITCVLLMGGERDIPYMLELFKYIKSKGLKTAWYCGLDMVPSKHTAIMQYLDYLKIGHFDMELGGLDSPITNQTLYLIEHQGDGSFYETDITFKFRNNES